MTNNAKAAGGWVYEGWRTCPACQGCSKVQGQTSYPVFPPAGPCPCGDGPLARVGQERKTFATRAELAEHLDVNQVLEALAILGPVLMRGGVPEDVRAEITLAVDRLSGWCSDFGARVGST
jgi:hypothetical protein